ncbi:MAG: hypothetical protein ACI9FJ_002637 [Alteromonadaceae bacterium]
MKFLVRIWFISVFLLLFTVQTVALVIESDTGSSHDPIHHALESGHVEAEQQGQEHLHLCHHHHGEHSAKVLPQPVAVFLTIAEQNTAFVYTAHYQNIYPHCHYRPPINQ